MHHNIYFVLMLAIKLNIKIMILVLLLTQTLAQQVYNHQTSSLSLPSWMSQLDNGIPLRDLSIIGSHNSMSQGIWGDAFQSQSNSLNKQLMMGFRALDIRCRHYHDSLVVHDRFVYLNVDLSNVLSTVAAFLQSYPMETVLVHICEEYNPSGNSGTFESAYLSIRNNFLNVIWSPTSQNPVLGETRGKIVIIQDFTASAIYGLLYSTFTVLPHKVYGTNWDQYDKWLAVKSFLASTNSSGSSRISFWTGYGGSFPYFVASGKSSPGNGDPRLVTGLTTPAFSSSYPDFPRVACFWGMCTIVFQGINRLAFDYIVNQGYTYLGIVFTDFIGDDVISKSVSLNVGKFTPCPLDQTTQGCSYCTNTGQCLGCNTTLNYVYNPSNYSCLAASGYYLFWNTSTVNTPITCNSSMAGCITCLSQTVCTLCDLLAHYQLVNGTCAAAPGYYLNSSNIPVVCTLTGCYECQSATVCSVCSSTQNYIINNNSLCQCDTANLFMQDPSSLACICIPGYFQSSNGSCESIPLCPANNSGCLNCSPTPSCLACDTASFFITYPSNPALCVCESSYYFDGSGCVPCNATLSAGCLDCASATLCLSCAANFTRFNGDCSCLPEYYQFNASTCLQCAVGCLICTSGSTCQVCDTANNFTLVSGVCECNPGMFLNGTTCQLCGAMPGCLTCTNSGCTSCDPVFGFSLNTTESLCECDYGYYINDMNVCAQCTQLACLACTSLTACLACNSYFYLSSGQCLQVCGDGFLFTLACDDGNLINGDGCSSTCSVENDYTCVGGSNTSPSLCSFSGTLSLVVNSVIKDPSANVVYLSASLSPALTELGSLDFNQVITPNFPVSSRTTTYDPASGAIEMTFSYDTSLNNMPLTVSFQPPSTPTFFYMKMSTASLPATTNNNLALKVYSASEYNEVPLISQCLLGLGIAALAVCFLSIGWVSKLMGVEMILIFQVGYCALLTIQKLQLFMVPLKNLRITNGYNEFLSDSAESNIPGRLSSINYKGSFLSNFNLDVVIVLLPLLIGLTILIVAKIRHKKQTRLLGYRWLKEWFISALLIVQMYLEVTVFLALLYDNSSMKMAGIAIGAILLAILLLMVILFVKYPKNFGQYKQFFRQGKLPQNWYIIVVLYRLIFSGCLGYLSNSDFCGYVLLGLTGVFLLALIVIRPYLSNVRPIINNVLLLCILAIYVYCSINKNSEYVTVNTSYTPLFLIGLFGVALVFNLICIIAHKIQDCRQKRKLSVDQKLVQNQEQYKKVDKEYINELKAKIDGNIVMNREMGKMINIEKLQQQDLNTTRKIMSQLRHACQNSNRQMVVQLHDFGKQFLEEESVVKMIQLK